MFLNVCKQTIHISQVHISQNVEGFNVKSSTYYFHVKTKRLADFQICISDPLTKSFVIDIQVLSQTRNDFLLYKRNVSYSEPSRTSKMVLSAKIINDFKLLPNLPKSSILSVRLGSVYVFASHVYRYKRHVIYLTTMTFLEMLDLVYRFFRLLSKSD